MTDTQIIAAIEKYADSILGCVNTSDPYFNGISLALIDVLFIIEKGRVCDECDFKTVEGRVSVD